MTNTELDHHRTDVENAPLFAKWIRARGGLAIWNCVNLSDPGKTWTTPVNTPEGPPMGKPHWSAGEVIRVITDPEEVLLDVPQVVKRFHVAVRMGSQGMSLKVTDGGSRRIRKEVQKAGKGAYYVFDYMSDENCLILKPDPAQTITLKQWMDQHPPEVPHA